jgi:Ni,Fe-hydrogenase III small subunit
MKNLMTPSITLAIVFLAAMAAVALRVAARRPEPRWAPGAESAPIAVRTPGSPGRPASAVEQMQDIFHELHADGRNAACTVCDSQYWLA